MLLFWKTIASFVLINVSKTYNKASTLAQRTIVFEDSKVGVRLSGSSLENHWKISKTHCATLCNRHPNCFSFNFCDSDVCQLNFKDSFFGSVAWENDHNCVFTGMRYYNSPVCKEGDEIREINDDSNPNRCKINNKKRLSPVFQFVFFYNYSPR